MKLTEVIGVCGLVVAVLGGVYSVGVLRGRIDALAPETVRAAQEEARRAIDARLEAFNTAPATVLFEWQNGAEPVQMITVDEGICYLTVITGFSHNRHEDVAKVFVLGDHWYLGGPTLNYATGAKARCWRFPVITDPINQERNAPR